MPQYRPLIESGSLEPGISPADFRLPAATALRFEKPAAPLRHLLPSYIVFDSDASIWAGASTWKLPSWSQIWIILADGPISVQVRNRHYASLGKTVFYGGTSKSMPVTSNGGVSVVVDVSPMGWARMFDASAEELRDRITPLDQFWPQGWAEDLLARVHASDRARDIKPLLDDFFLERMPPPHRHEPEIEAINERLLAEESMESHLVADALGIHPRMLLRLCARYFGYGPKMLMRRTRFLRAFIGMLLSDEAPDFSAVPPGYHDVPHFLRDSKQFLGLTPRQYLAIDMPYLRAVLRARRLVLGSPLSLLDRNLRAPSVDGEAIPLRNSL